MFTKDKSDDELSSFWENLEKIFHWWYYFNDKLPDWGSEEWEKGGVPLRDWVYLAANLQVNVPYLGLGRLKRKNKQIYKNNWKIYDTNKIHIMSKKLLTVIF